MSDKMSLAEKIVRHGGWGFKPPDNTAPWEDNDVASELRRQAHELEMVAKDYETLASLKKSLVRYGYGPEKWREQRPVQDPWPNGSRGSK